MNIFTRIKVWWKTKTTAEKLYIFLGGVSTVATVTSTVCAVRTAHSLDNVKFDIKLYPEGKDDPNPITAKLEDVDFSAKPVVTPVYAGQTDPYELARDLYNTLEQHYDEGDPEKLEKALETSLQLAWDLAAREDRLDSAMENSEIPTQVHD